MAEIGGVKQQWTLFRDNINQAIFSQDGLIDSVQRTWLPDCLPKLAGITENDHKLNREYFKVYGPYTLPVDMPFWMLITTDDGAVTVESSHVQSQNHPIVDNKVQVRCTRYVKWRDEVEGRQLAP